MSARAPLSAPQLCKRCGSVVVLVARRSRSIAYDVQTRPYIRQPRHTKFWCSFTRDAIELLARAYDVFDDVFLDFADERVRVARDLVDQLEPAEWQAPEWLYSHRRIQLMRVFNGGKAA